MVDAVEEERRRLADTSESRLTKIASCYRTVDLELEELARRNHELDDLSPPTASELRLRLAGEDDFAEELIVSRREAEHAKTLAPFRAAVEESEHRIRAIREQLAELEAEISNDLLRTRSRALRYCAFTDGLRALYWRALVRIHRDGKELAKVVPPPHDTTPAWVHSGDYKVVLEVKLPDRATPPSIADGE